MINQLVLTKYIFMQGEQYSNKNDSYSSGLAISLFQDAAELLVRTIIKKLDLNVKDQEPFNGLLVAIQTNSHDKKLPHKAKIIELNKARVNVKHYGILPNPSEAIKFKGYTEDFLRICTDVYFDEDFDSISLANLISDKTLLNHIKTAETLLINDDIDQCIFEIAKADCLLSGKLEKLLPKVDRKFTELSRLFDRSHSSIASQHLKYLYEYLNTTRDFTIVSMLGISLTDYVRLIDIKPIIGKYSDGEYVYYKKNDNPTKDDATFYIKYLVDLAIKVQNML